MRLVESLNPRTTTRMASMPSIQLTSMKICQNRGRSKNALSRLASTRLKTFSRLLMKNKLKLMKKKHHKRKRRKKKWRRRRKNLRDGILPPNSTLL